MPKLVHGLAFGLHKFYIAPNGKINCGLVNLSYNCDVGLGLEGKQCTSYAVCNFKYSKC